MERKSTKGLSASEWKVIHIVRELGPCAARDVYNITTEKYGWTPVTTKTFLRRLVEKGHLTTTQVGNCYVYRLSDSVLDALYETADTLMENAFEGTAVPLLYRMVKKGKLTPDDARELQSLLDEYRKTEGREKESDDSRNRNH